MSVLPIVLHPDPRLSKTCREAEKVTDEMRDLANSMLDTMYDAPGVGLAAPQVGSNVRLFVMDCTDKEEDSDPRVLINPQITWQSDEQNTYNEGCLSLPELYADVERPAEVKLRYWDLDEQEQEAHFTGLWATCAQHELDHLNGVLFIDHLSRMKRQMMTKKMIKFKKELVRA